jgi:hypothetical protein
MPVPLPFGGHLKFDEDPAVPSVRLLFYTIANEALCNGEPVGAIPFQFVRRGKAV